MLRYPPRWRALPRCKLIEKAVDKDYLFTAHNIVGIASLSEWLAVLVDVNVMWHGSILNFSLFE